MSTPGESMLAIADKSDKRKAVPNLLPCRIRHTGPIDSISGYWAPSSPKQGMGHDSFTMQQAFSDLVYPADEPRVAYFRGRKLHGRAVAVPDRYEGVVVRREAGERKRKHSQLCREDEDDGAVAADTETETATATATLQVTARFDEVLVWAHEATMDSTDEYVRGVEEWLQVANKIHSIEERDGSSGTDMATVMIWKLTTDYLRNYE
ncbi:hypothetical protein CDD80_7318 [Ophiocordyceps camponoti-rufipedis]|uniref:Uncharacterized protein n=1 Tax=Ophiocordyceps camponoti-rufipedis TaxID=2004952 RepID=A0A2C5ZFE0_9HYPO|nr:hypothetical protein CDD80_7318 [Ophiocordyceps camponoti-rufipedis]